MKQIKVFLRIAKEIAKCVNMIIDYAIPVAQIMNMEIPAINVTLDALHALEVSLINVSLAKVGNSLNNCIDDIYRYSANYKYEYTLCNYCGDGFILTGDNEECDDGNQVDGDGCSA